MRTIRYRRRSFMRNVLHRLNLLDFNLNGHSRRNAVAKQEGVVVGLQVDVDAAEIKDRLAKAVLVLDRRIEDLALRAEGSKLTEEDFEEDARYGGSDIHDFADLPPKRLRAAVRRRLSRLNDAKAQVQFLADHVITGATYRLDAEDARRLATIHCDVD